jgi:hypothetical protein
MLVTEEPQSDDVASLVGTDPKQSTWELLIEDGVLALLNNTKSVQRPWKHPEPTYIYLDRCALIITENRKQTDSTMSNIEQKL